MVNSKVKKIIILFLTLSMLSVSNSFVSAQRNDHTVSGKVTLNFKFKSSETSDVRKWLLNSNECGKNYLKNQIAITTDEDKLNLLNKALEDAEKFKVDDLLKVTNDGSSQILEPVPYAQVCIDGEFVNTDQYGKYVFKSVKPGKHKVIISRNGYTITQKDLNVSEDDRTIDGSVNTQITSADLTSALRDMEKSMASPQAIRYYQHYPKNTTLVYGNEGMTVVTDTDIVSCNEISKNSSSSSDIRSNLAKTDFSSFPLNNSDCANSIGLGILANNNIIAYIFYYNSVNCAIEAAQAVGRRMHLSSTNVYCNGTNKSGHYNCSWFNGIGHSEKLHTDN